MPYLALAFVIGCLIPLQAAVNNNLKGVLGSSTLLASLVSFSVGTVALGVVAALAGEKWRSLAGVTDAKAWQLTGGLLGALFVFGTTFLAPRIGVAKMVALIIAGQVLVSLLIDQQGWLGLAMRELTPVRVGGALLVVVGVVLVNFEQLFRT